MKCISSSFFGKLIGDSTIIKISESGLSIEVNGQISKVNWSEMIAPPIFEMSFLGQMLSFKTTEKNYLFTLLAYSTKRIHKNDCQQLWALANIKTVAGLLSTINKIITTRYIQQSTFDLIRLTVNKALEPWSHWAYSTKCPENIHLKVKELSSYQHWGEQEIDDCRESYISHQLQVHQHFFDQVESNPLTLSQRRACIIDNDNNLLLAGAGTGKTSVMVGRTGYLLESLQAQHDEILLLAYGRKAADEMDERIKDKLNTDKINATTFHRLGLDIITEVEGVKPSLSAFSEDEKLKLDWVQTCFEQLIYEDEQYRVLTLNYFIKYYYLERSDFDFNHLGERHQYYDDNDIRSLKGEKVKSFGELYIANFLFTHGIEYHYEKNYRHDVKTLGRRQYQPDFFLPELDTYIDYYGTDEQGNTATYIDNDDYHKSIEWKRATHEKFNTLCIEFTYGQYKNGQLLDSLTDYLNGRQVPLKKLTDEQIVSSLNDSGRISALAKIFCQLVGLYKAACLDSRLERTVVANSADPKQTEKALQLLKPILLAYEQHLQNHVKIDFEDMINKAVKYVVSGAFASRWRFIMVDEFQDISEPRARLVRALRDNYLRNANTGKKSRTSNNECSVFAVGDDWQAIYRFSGADFTLTTQFSSYFGVTTQTTLDQTFRFNNQIGKVATDFISKNPAQIAKTIQSLKQVKAPAVSLLKRDSYSLSSPGSNIPTEMANGAIDDVLAAISAKVCTPVTVYLLARFWFQLPNQTEVNRLNNQYPLLKIQCHSFHASKGKEADYVVLMGLNKGKHGFPSKKVTPALVDALLAKKEDFAYAEERRVFYVALTRAKDRVYIIVDMTDVSPFVKELVNDHHIECNEFESTASQEYADDMKCSVCETGTLKKRTGKYGDFYACSYFPRCDHKEKSTLAAKAQ